MDAAGPPLVSGGPLLVSACPLSGVGIFIEGRGDAFLDMRSYHFAHQSLASWCSCGRNCLFSHFHPTSSSVQAFTPAYIGEICACRGPPLSSACLSNPNKDSSFYNGVTTPWVPSFKCYSDFVIVVAVIDAPRVGTLGQRSRLNSSKVNPNWLTHFTQYSLPLLYHTTHLFSKIQLALWPLPQPHFHVTPADRKRRR